ncbi:hypothetical protein ABE501_08010 [Comamonas testosteroni]
MNPELRRQLSLELTSSRLVLMPAILLLMAVCVFMIEQQEPLLYLHQGALVVMGLLAACVGTFTALSSINDEVNERTWDQQRMSAMGPWRMAWGKLLGGPSYAWYGALLCAAAAFASGVLLGRTGHTLQTVLLCVLGVGALHCALMASRLYGMDPAKPAGSRSTWGLVIIVFILVQMVGGLVVGLDSLLGNREAVRWWGMPVAAPRLALFLAALALLLGLLALWRAMAMQLSVPTTPWAWALGNAAACVLLLGLVPDNTARVLGAIALLVLATYYAAALENQVAQRWRSVLYNARHGRWRRVLQSLPLWPVSWCMAFAVLLPAYILWNADPLAARDHLGPFVLMVLLHVLRDCGIHLFFALRNSYRSPLGMTMLVLLVLGGILPAMLWSTGLAPLFEPLFGALAAPLRHTMTNAPALGWLAWIGMLVQLVAVAAAILWRFRQLAPTAQGTQWPLQATGR